MSSNYCPRVPEPGVSRWPTRLPADGRISPFPLPEMLATSVLEPAASTRREQGKGLQWLPTCCCTKSSSRGQASPYISAIRGRPSKRHSLVSGR